MHVDVRRSMAVGVALSLLSACGGAAREIPQAGPSTSSVAQAASAPAPRPPAPAVVFPSEPIEPVAAPFPVPQFVRPQFPAAVFDIRDFGAVADGKTKNTDAIRQAIEKAAASGGGSVLVPPGRWLTGPIKLKSNINLYVATDAELLFSQDFTDYLPPVFTRWEGTEMLGYSPLIYAKDCENVAITGGGKLNGQGEAWFPWKKSRVAAEQLYDLAAAGVPPEKRVFATEGTLRPSFIQTVSCKNVLIEGVTITSGPFWTIHPVYSENVIIRRVHVETEGPNTDGCDPDSSKNVLIEDSFFSTGDDCVVIKSGLNEDGWRVGKPSENIIVRRLHGEKGHGGVVVGSEMSGGVKNVWVTDCEFKGTDRGLRIKAMRGRGGTVENVYYENVKHEDLRLMAVEMTTFYNSSNVKPKTEKPPTIRGVHVKNITTHGAAQAVDIVGLPELPISDVTFDNVDIASQTGVRCIDCKGVRFSHTKITPQTGLPFQLDNAKDVSFDQSCTGAPSTCIERVGRASTELHNDGKIIPDRALPLHPKPASAAAQ
jgi:polygalacturonase